MLSFPSGEHEFAWDGRDDEGQALPPGFYQVRVHFATDSDAPDTMVPQLIRLIY